MNLKPLRHFQLVAEELNYHKAAERAHLSQPAISHSIKALETKFGERLFDRSSRAVKLTPFGRGVLEHANNLLSEANNFETGVENLQLGASGRVSIGMATTVAEGIGGRAIVAFGKLRPKISFDVSVYNSNHILDRLSQELDHFVLCDAQTAASRQGLTVDNWGQQTGGFFCRPNHPILQMRNPTFSLAHSFGLVSFNVTNAVRRELETMLGIEGSTFPLLQIASDNLKMCRDISMASDHILIAEIANVQSDIETGNLVQIKLNHSFNRQLCIATKTSRMLPLPATLMISFLKENRQLLMD